MLEEPIPSNEKAYRQDDADDGQDNTDNGMPKAARKLC
jgi:hypothetical protein